MSRIFLDTLNVDIFLFIPVIMSFMTFFLKGVAKINKFVKQLYKTNKHEISI